MLQAQHNSDLEELEGEVAGNFRLLRFSPRLEKLFEHDSLADRCRHIVRQNYIGLTTYHAFLFADFHSVRDAYVVDLCMHFLVMTPIVVIVHVLMSRRPPAWLREGSLAVSLVALTATIVVVVEASRSNVRDLVQLSIILVILFAVLMQRVRFWYFLASCLVIQVLFSASLWDILHDMPDRVIMTNAVFTGTLIFMLVGSYTLEHQERMAYLFRLRDRLRNRDLETLSTHDALTGVGNRRALDAAFARLSATRDPCRQTSVILIDIDHFKSYNDTNGHQEGDRCLARIAMLIGGSLRRDSQSLYRFGGEEFLILLADTTLESGLHVAERIRATVVGAALPTATGGAEVVSISAGVSCGCLGAEATPTSLIAAADSELYRAKRNGRNQVSPPLHIAPPALQVA